MTPAAFSKWYKKNEDSLVDLEPEEIARKAWEALGIIVLRRIDRHALVRSLRAKKEREVRDEA